MLTARVSRATISLDDGLFFIPADTENLVQRAEEKRVDTKHESQTPSYRARNHSMHAKYGNPGFVICKI